MPSEFAPSTPVPSESAPDGSGPGSGSESASHPARHPLHAPDRSWPQTNCYADLWIEVLAHLGCEPLAAFGFTVAQDWEGDHFTFFKPPLEDLEALYGLRVDELAIYDDVPGHAALQLARGRLVTIEVDSFFLPDTRGVSYRTEHGKTTIAVVGIDAGARTLDYFHGVGRYALSGEDWEGVFLTDAPPERPFLPYAEVVKPHAAPAAPDLRAEAERRLARHLGRAPAHNPLRAFQAAAPAQVAALAERPFAHFHLYAFNTLRQVGANFELLASHLAWLGDEAGAGPALTIAQGAKAAQFQLARALAKRRFDALPATLDPAADAWDALLAHLRARSG